jgi:hypothetical protein
MEEEMKWIMALLMLVTYAHASDGIQQQKDNYFNAIETVDIDRPHPLSMSWSTFLSDSCTMYYRHVTNEDELRQIGLRRCKDGSISFVQPDSDGWNGWEGKCGQTAASNSLFHMCQKGLDPDKYIDPYLRDRTPGVRPNTLQKGLNRISNKHKDTCPTTQRWIASYLGNQANFIAKLKQHLIPNYSHGNLIQLQRNGEEKLRQPVIVLVQNPGGNYLHWVTVVDVMDQGQCHFVVNHWDNQYLIPCKTLAQWSGKVGKTYPIILKSYSTVTYR